MGEQAYLKIQPYWQRSLATRPYEKLASRFYGPFTVLEQIGQVAYKLDMPPTRRIHPVFHVSQLKKVVGTTPVAPTLSPQLSSDLELMVEPEMLLDARSRTLGDTAHTEVLVKWVNMPLFEATWERAEVIDEQFPEFHLEDKVKVLVGVVQRTAKRNHMPHLTYTMRRLKT